jgi:hypothetical protein
MEQIYLIKSDFEDEYKLRISSDNSGILSDEVYKKINENGILVFNIELERTKGTNITSQKVLSKIEECIAETLLTHNNSIFCFFCDFISLIPKMKRSISVQEYRSRLFSSMFERYPNIHEIKGIRNHVVIIEGCAENYYVHVIARDKHLHIVKTISESIQKDFGK